MKTVGDMWGTGMFKANACDFCDDVTTELADISLGDAWMSPYMFDGKGTNVIVSRSNTSEKLINNGIEKGELFIENLNKEKFIFSQKGSFNHRQLGLPYRIKKAQINKLLVPPKRVEITRTSIDLKLVQFFRMKVRAKSFEAWKKSKNAAQFNQEMSLILFILKKVTKINHYKRTILSKDFIKAIKRKFNN